MKNMQCMCLTGKKSSCSENGIKDAKEGIVVAGGRGKGSALNTVVFILEGLFVDTSGTIYVVDARNERVKCS